MKEFNEKTENTFLDTDYAHSEKVEMIRERYRVQIGYYARALEMLTGKRVKEKYISFLEWGSAGVLVSVLNIFIVFEM